MAYIAEQGSTSVQGYSLVCLFQRLGGRSRMVLTATTLQP